MQGLVHRTRLWRASLLGTLIVAVVSLSPQAKASAVELPPAVEGVTISALAPGVRAYSVTIGPDENLWFAGPTHSDSAGQIGKLDQSGTVTELTLEGKKGSYYPYGIVKSPDGNMWFAREGLIARIDSAGEIAEFPLPDKHIATVLTAAPDGSIWFSEEGASRIGHVTAAGAVAELSLPSDRKPFGIVAGPDGGIWFTERGSGAIGRLDPAGGAITEFPLPDRGSKPRSIAVGADGNLWFTEEARNRIGRIAPDGAIEQFRIPVLDPMSIAMGPDDKLWYTTYSRVGSISLAGEPGSLTCLTTSCRLPPTSIAVGGHGELWLGTSTEYPAYGGGGAYILADMHQPGYIAKLVPPVPAVKLGRLTGTVAAGRTSVEVRCEAQSGCRGALGLTRSIAAYPHHSLHLDRLRVARQRYELAAGEARRIHLRLNRRAEELLARRGSLPVWATAGRRVHTEAARLVVLHGV